MSAPAAFPPAADRSAPAPATHEPPAREPQPAAARPAASRPARRLRSVVFWAHLAAGALTGIVILAMSVTGVLLAYQRQLNERAVAQQMASHAPGAPRLPLDTLVARALVDAPAGTRATGVTLRANADAPVAVALEGRPARNAGSGPAAGGPGGPGGARRTAWVDPVTGAVLPGSPRLQAFFGTTERVHRSLALGRGVRTPLGTALTGVSNLVFLFLLVSGLYLWMPRRWTRRAVAAVAVPDLRARGRARDWNWHHVMGLWTAPALIVVVGSAAFLSYEWPQRVIARAAGGPAPAGERREGGGERGSGARGGERPGGERGEGRDAGETSREAAAPRVALDTLAARALAAAGTAAPSAWYSVQLRLPSPGGPGAREVAATVSTVRALRPDRRVTVTLGAGDGAVVKQQRYADLDAGRRARGWARFLHTGEAFGATGQTVAMLASLAGVGLVWTGFALALRRAARAVRGGRGGTARAPGGA